jgi:Lar family restriction alleviation protein
MTDQSDYPPLRPCPFCGKVPPLGVEWDDSVQAWVMACNLPCGTWVIDATSRAEAADKWNRRAKL